MNTNALIERLAARRKQIKEILADSAYHHRSGVYQNAKTALLRLSLSEIEAIWAVVFTKRQQKDDK